MVRSKDRRRYNNKYTFLANSDSPPHNDYHTPPLIFMSNSSYGCFRLVVASFSSPDVSFRLILLHKSRGMASAGRGVRLLLLRPPAPLCIFICQDVQRNCHGCEILDIPPVIGRQP
ncbi:hypothetical protein T4B_11770 [Trichinella pseudospiralis]|uniref:Uncharacterized protein n=1 Tax=Trichinella pseudospiralis TaxID=6337 RepID=A0A0V1H702_TRIPS|nr:hypothetical protein T4B_11770 [Trichinella pseudospiralis]